jgi:hypothetical protein
MTTNSNGSSEREGASVVLNLDDPADRALVSGTLKFAPGLMPGEENEGLVSGRAVKSPPRLADFDDSSWETPKNIRDVVGAGFTFAWYRFTITLPARVKGLEVAGAQVWFSMCADDYGEVWVDCPPFGPDFSAARAIAQNKLSPTVGYNAENRILISPRAEVGYRHVMACLAINAPIAQPLGGVFLRYARLEISQGMARIPI